MSSPMVSARQVVAAPMSCGWYWRVTFSAPCVKFLLPPKMDSQKIGEAMQEAGYLLSYNSEYLRSKNWIQACLIGECTKEKVVALANALNRVLGFPQPRRIYHMERNAFDLNGFAQCITRSAGDIGNDGALVTGQSIEQRRFADIGLPGNHDMEPATQQAALLGTITQARDIRLQFLQPLRCIGVAQHIDFLVGKIQSGLDQHA